MDALKKEEFYTIDDIYALPEGERAELIDGKLYNMAPPNTRHQRLIHFFDREIGNYIQRKNGECEVFPSPFAVFLNEDDVNYVEPDISVICDKNKLDDQGCHGAPDWIIEIVSPGSKSMDPMRGQVTVYGFEKDIVEQYSFGEEMVVGIYEDFSITIE